MLRGFRPTPEQAGHAIALSICKMPFLDRVNEIERQLLAQAKATEDQLMTERFLLYCAASRFAIEQFLEKGSERERVLAGFKSWFIENAETSERVSTALRELDNLVSLYGEAAQADVEDPPRGPGTLSYVEGRFAERFFETEEQDEKRIEACLVLASTASRVLWNNQVNVARQMLVDAGILVTQ